MEESKQKKDIYLLGIGVVALIAMLGSLFFSEIQGYEPCKLCWYQRILMYPMTIVLLAYIKKQTEVYLYTLIFAVIGACVSIYHYLMQKVPALSEQGSACGLVPCNGEYINWLGFITIPFLAGTAFIIIIVLSILGLTSKKS